MNFPPRRAFAFLSPAVLVAVGVVGLASLDRATSPAREAEERAYLHAQLADAARADGQWTAHQADAPGLRRVYLSADAAHCVLEVESPPAYNGAIRFLLGIDADASGAGVRGVRIVRHTETPGVGTRIEDAAWLSALTGLRVSSRGEWSDANDGGGYAALTGATVSGDALLEAVRTTLAQARAGCEGFIVQ